MQEVAVFILFFGVVGYLLFRFFKKDKGQGCASCDFNQEAKSK
jgi:hypothetical protein